MIKLITKFTDDLLLFLGVVLLSIGVFQIYIPAGYIVLGISLIVFAYFYAQRSVDHWDGEEF